MTAAIATLIASLESGDLAQRQGAAEQLARLETGAQPAAVALVQACGTDDDSLRDWATTALEGLGPPASTDIARLMPLATDPSVDVAYWACTLLGRLPADARPATPKLAEALGTHEDPAVRQRAAWALGEIGYDSAPVRAALEAAAVSTDSRLATLARSALGQLRP